MLLPQSRIQTPLQKALVVASIAFGALCFAILVYAVEHSYRSPSPGPERDKQEDNIKEAVFRYQFVHNASGLQQKAGVYFLSLWGVGEDGKDPSDDFMRRFAGHTPPVKKFSRASFEDGLKDEETGARGLIFRVTVIKWITGSRVEVGGGYYEGQVSSSGNTYYVEKRDGKWVVVRDKMYWIS